MTESLKKVREALEKCRFALEPYDDVKPRDWKTDRENLRDAHKVTIAALSALSQCEQDIRARALTDEQIVNAAYAVDATRVHELRGETVTIFDSDKELFAFVRSLISQPAEQKGGE